jgi:hypothetical protein
MQAMRAREQPADPGLRLALWSCATSPKTCSASQGQSINPRCSPNLTMVNNPSNQARARKDTGAMRQRAVVSALTFARMWRSRLSWLSVKIELTKTAAAIVLRPQANAKVGAWVRRPPKLQLTGKLHLTLIQKAASSGWAYDGWGARRKWHRLKLDVGAEDALNHRDRHSGRPGDKYAISSPAVPGVTACLLAVNHDWPVRAPPAAHDHRLCHEHL